MTIGNHEFDFGVDNMERIFKMANFPVVCANYNLDATVLKDIVTVSYTHLLRDKETRIGGKSFKVLFHHVLQSLPAADKEMCIRDSSNAYKDEMRKFIEEYHQNNK